MMIRFRLSKLVNLCVVLFPQSLQKVVLIELNFFLLILKLVCLMHVVIKQLDFISDWLVFLVSVMWFVPRDRDGVDVTWASLILLSRILQCSSDLIGESSVCSWIICPDSSFSRGYCLVPTDGFSWAIVSNPTSIFCAISRCKTAFCPQLH